jgi:hypothetical protein
MARRKFSSTAARTTLSAPATDVATTITVVALTGYPATFPYTIIVDADTVNEEVMEVTGVASLTLTVTRGVDGTTGVAHSAGATVQHGVSARDFDEANAFINEGGTVGGPVQFPAGSVTAPSITPTGDPDTGIYFPVANNVSIATAGVQRLAINSAGRIYGTGTSLGAWTAYSPTISGTGWAIGNGTIVAAYCQIGNMVHFRIRVIFGSTSTFGTTGMVTQLPSASAVSDFVDHALHGVAYDASAATYYLLNARLQGTGSVMLMAVTSASGALGPVISTVPFTWATTDQIRIDGTYEAA